MVITDLSFLLITGETHKLMPSEKDCQFPKPKVMLMARAFVFHGSFVSEPLKSLSIRDLFSNAKWCRRDA